jgi:hypothetical protein
MLYAGGGQTSAIDGWNWWQGIFHFPGVIVLWTVHFTGGI